MCPSTGKCVRRSASLSDHNLSKYFASSCMPHTPGKVESSMALNNVFILFFVMKMTLSSQFIRHCSPSTILLYSIRLAITVGGESP